MPPPYKHSRDNALCFLYTNIRSILSKTIPLSSLIDSCSASLIAVTQTWLTDDIFLTHASYNIFRCDRANRRGGGVLLAIKSELSCLPIMITTFLECVWVLLKGSSADILIGVFYRAPDMGSGFAEEFFRILSEVCNRFSNCSLLIFGDFNYPHINWTTLSVAANERESNSFLQSCLDFSLSQLIMQPTRRTATCSSILDLILTNVPDICANIRHLDGFSDHDVITGNIVCPPISRKIITKKIKCYNRANFDRINADLYLFADQFRHNYLSRTVNDNWTAFRNVFTGLICKYIPTITIRSNSSTTWFTQILRRRKKNPDCIGEPSNAITHHRGLTTNSATGNTRLCLKPLAVTFSATTYHPC